MNFSSLTPQIEDFRTQFPGWPEVVGTAVVYVLIGVVLYFLVKAVVVRFIRRQSKKAEKALTLPPGAARDRALANNKRRMQKVQVAIQRVVKLVITIICFVFAIGDLFPSLDMLSGSVSILIIGGTALGLAGALQPFIRDIIGGSLIFFEDAYAIGDFVKVAGVEGTVEELHLRRTVIRSSDGAVHVVPNGAVGIATNMSRVWATSTVEIVLAHDVDLDKAIGIADRTASALAEDPDWADRVIETPRVTRVSDVSPDGVTIRLAGRVVTGEAGAVAGELRRRLHNIYLEDGIPLARRHDAVTGPMPTSSVAAKATRSAKTVRTAPPGRSAASAPPAAVGVPAAAPTPVSVAPDPATAGVDRRGTGSDPRTLSGRR